MEQAGQPLCHVLFSVLGRGCFVAWGRLLFLPRDPLRLPGQMLTQTHDKRWVAAKHAIQVVRREHYLAFMEWFVYTLPQVALPVKVRLFLDEILSCDGRWVRPYCCGWVFSLLLLLLLFRCLTMFRCCG